MTKEKHFAAGQPESQNACGADVSPENTSTTSVGMTGGRTATKQESHALRGGSVKQHTTSKFMLHFTIHIEKRNFHSGADAKTDSLVASFCNP